jgi:deoxyadenosine/deoxycytidine kinase
MIIAIEGCVGSGKSTVAQGLATYRKSLPLLEEFDKNPFLNAFYEDPNSNALETEFAFLLLHFHQMKAHRDTICGREVITDFTIAKDVVYADMNLHDPATKRIFKEFYSHLSGQLAKPALTIFLNVSTDLLIERIRNRKRDFELKIDPAYYARINEAYEGFRAQYTGEKLEISMDEWNFVKAPDLYRKLSNSIDEHIIVK